MVTDLASDVEKLRASLGFLPEPIVQPTFVVVSGLPGSGKSFFSRRLAERLPSVVLESDVLRQWLFSNPTHSPEESARLFRACHSLIEELLEQGIPVIFDATNLSERHREILYHIAEKLKVKLILVRVEAPVEVVRQRLKERATSRNPDDHSQADWEVYRKMSSYVEKVGRRHFAVDTSWDVTPVIDKILREANR